MEGSHEKTLKNVSLLANEANRAHLELFRSRSGEFGALSIKMIREAFFFTCYDVFDVIGWFPCEKTEKRAFTCKRSKQGRFGAVRVNSVLESQNDPIGVLFHVF